MLDLVDETFHQMALPIEVFIVLGRFLAPGPGRNYRNSSGVQNLLPEVI
jgi:hypothetical protein